MPRRARGYAPRGGKGACTHEDEEGGDDREEDAEAEHDAAARKGGGRGGGASQESDRAWLGQQATRHSGACESGAWLGRRRLGWRGSGGGGRSAHKPALSGMRQPESSSRREGSQLARRCEGEPGAVGLDESEGEGVMLGCGRGLSSVWDSRLGQGRPHTARASYRAGARHRSHLTSCSCPGRCPRAPAWSSRR